jgi:hypothetical protein
MIASHYTQPLVQPPSFSPESGNLWETAEHSEVAARYSNAGTAGAAQQHADLLGQAQAALGSSDILLCCIQAPRDRALAALGARHQLARAATSRGQGNGLRRRIGRGNVWDLELWPGVSQVRGPLWCIFL